LKCTWCGKKIIGEVVAAGWEDELVYFDGDEETVLEAGREIGFCSRACAWRYGIERHKAMGMSGKEIRKHLIEEHGLEPS